jgi:SPP1 gp7 family putative phage head morphogenesis protein
MANKNYFENSCRLYDNIVLLSEVEGDGHTHYRFYADGGNNSCDKCLELDGQIIEISEAKAGVNVPPLHPNCRCEIEIMPMEFMEAPRGEPAKPPTEDDRDTPEGGICPDEAAKIRKAAEDEDVLADFNSFWYTSVFSPGIDWGQCPWYARGRMAEMNDGARITFGEGSGRGHGGLWIKNAEEKAYIYDENGERTGGYRKVYKETDPFKVVPNSAVSFQFYVAGGWHGHVMYIENVEVIDGVTMVYFSDSNNGKPSGTVQVRELNNFINMFNYDRHGNERNPQVPGETLFQGYIILSDEIFFD